MKTKIDLLNEFGHEKDQHQSEIILVEILLDVRDQLARIASEIEDKLSKPGEIYRGEK